MAYGQKYLFRFESRAGRDISIKVYKDGYSGVVIQRPIGQAPVLKKEKSGPICGTSLSFYPECHVDQEFSEFYTSDPLEYRVDLYSGATLVWRGFITPELYSEPDVAPPYDVEVVATDGLGELKLHDYVGQGLVSIRAQLSYLLAYTGISANVNFAGELNVTNPVQVAASGLLSSVKIGLDYMAGESCYDVLSLLLDTLHAEITTYNGAWLVSRETDITRSNGRVKYYNASGTAAYFNGSVKSEGKMGIADMWPVGRLTTVVEPAKNSVTVQAPWHLASPLVNPGMSSDTGWTKAEATTYDAVKHAYKFIDDVVGVGSHLHQDIQLTSMKQAMALAIKFVGYANYPYASISASYTTGGTTYYIVQNSDGTLSWATSGSSYFAKASANASDGEPSNAQELSLEIPAFMLNGVFPPGTLRFMILAHSVYVCGASFEIVLPVGWQDCLTINNGARGAGDTVEILIGKETNDVADFKQFVQGIAVTGPSNSLCYGWADGHWSNMDFLALTSRGYALSIAASRLRSKGTLDVPAGLTSAPLVITQGQVAFWLQEWTWNLLEDELEIDALSLPSAALSISSEEVEVMDSGSSASSSSSGSGGSRGTVVSWGAASDAVQTLSVGGDSRDLLRKQTGVDGLLKADGTTDTNNYLPLSGGTLSNANYAQQLTIHRNQNGNDPVIAFSNKDGNLGYIGVGGSSNTFPNQPVFVPDGGSSKQIYHSGNSNKNDVEWAASSLTLNGALSGATTGAFSQGVNMATASGNVGIGTASPAAKLHVSGDIKSTGKVIFNDGSYISNAGNFHFGDASNHTWHVMTNTGTSLFQVCNGGYVGIGGINSAYKLFVNGNLLAASVVATGNVVAGSDRRWKENIKTFDDEGILKDLAPVEWDWREGHGEGHASGFVAQDIKDIMPYAVIGSEEEGYKLNYNCFHALWAKTIKRQEDRIESLENEVKELKEIIKRLI